MIALRILVLVIAAGFIGPALAEENGPGPGDPAKEKSAQADKAAEGDAKDRGQDKKEGEAPVGTTVTGKVVNEDDKD
jgi:hypothetical protein